MEVVGVNATSRLIGVDKKTILTPQKRLGCACAHYHDDWVRGLNPKSVQCDEIWSFNFCKQKNVAKTKLRDTSYGDVWLWTAIDSDTKLMTSYQIGLRGEADARAFMDDLAGRVIDIGTLVTDGHNAYPPSEKEALGKMVDYAQLVKTYESDREGQVRYSTASCAGCIKKSVIGFPMAEDISTSIVERSNLTLRVSMRRFTRLTNGHSKKLENHGHAVSLFLFYCNFCRKHQTLGNRTPAMAAGLADHVWCMDEPLGLID